MPQIPNATAYRALVSANADLAIKVWNAKVLADTRARNALKEFTGPEGSRLPICEKKDLEKNIGDTVYFTTYAPVRSQGTLGESTLLRENTDQLRFGTFNVEVDLLRHAVSWKQLLKHLRFTGKTIDQLTSDVMGEWNGRKEEDDFQMRLRRGALLEKPANLVRIGGHASRADLESSDMMNVNVIEQAKGLMTSQGAKEMQLDRDVSGADVLKYCMFLPDTFARPLRSSTHYLAALREADQRGDGNRLFNGKYAMWENMVIYPHTIRIDTADGRQGSPLAPRAYLGTALANATPTEITGGGALNSDGSGTGDYFAYFPGYGWKITEGETLPADEGPHYAIIYNLTDRKYEGISYTTGNNGTKITGVTRAVTTIIATGHARYSDAHPSGSLIIPCTVNGVPLQWGLVFGAEALFYAKGALDADPIRHEDDFTSLTSKTAHVNASGLQSIRGMTPYTDTIGRYPNYLLVEGAASIPEIQLLPYAG